MKLENNGKIIPVLDRKASKEQLINAINENTIKVNRIMDILEKMTLALETLTVRVLAAEEKEG